MMIKALLKRYRYPPDQEAAAIALVLQQTERISEEWTRQELGDKRRFRSDRDSRPPAACGADC